MSTPSNPQMTAVIVNVSRNRIATQNDIAKSDIINCLNTFLLSNMDKVSAEYVRHFEKHLDAITTKLGAPELREAYVPKQKFVFAE